MPGEIQLMCWVKGDKIENIFLVKVQLSDSVVHLKEAIWAKKPSFQQIEASSLEPLKFHQPLGNIDDGFAGSIKLEDGQRLEPFKLISDFWTQSPPFDVLSVILPRPAGTTMTPSSSSELSEGSQDQRSAKRQRLDVEAILLPSEDRVIALYAKLRKIHKDPSWYSEPRHIGNFPFPSMHKRRPVDRFPLTEEYFQYMGRERFTEVWDTVRSLKPGEYTQLFIEGTTGYGKSHLMAILACLLSRLDYRPVYIPDCRQLFHAPLAQFQTALLFAFSEPSLSLERSEIRTLQSLDQVSGFCRTQKTRLFFIVDQMNALDLVDGFNRDEVQNEAKQEMRRFLSNIFFGHYSITGASANYKTAKYMEAKQTSDRKISMRGGMSKREMECWWLHHRASLPTFDEEDKARVEDLTGCIPLFLRPLLKFSGKRFCDVELLYWGHDDLTAVGRNVRAFSATMRFSESGLNYERYYVEGLAGCMTISGVPGITNEWFDFRYFYPDKHEIGHYTCGLARNAAADVLREAKPGKLLDKRWFNTFYRFKDNRSIIGFLTQQACLSAISELGFHHGGLEWNSFPATIFSGDIIAALPHVTGEVFLVPQASSFKDLDAAYVRLDTDKKTVLVVPIKVTVNEWPKDSEASFYSRWSRWQERYRCFEMESTFVWIVEDHNSWETVEAKFRETRSGSRMISPSHGKLVITVADLYPDLGKQLEMINTA